MKKKQSGKLNKRITLQRYQKDADGYGGFMDDAAEASGTIWANVKFKSSNIVDEFGKVDNLIVAEFLVRKKAVDTYYTLNDTDTLIYNLNSYRINKVYDADIDNYTIIEATKTT